MTIKELKEKFEAIEDTLGLCVCEIDNTRIWDYIRYSTFLNLAVALGIIPSWLEIRSKIVRSKLKKSKSLSARLKRKIGKLQSLFRRISAHSIFVGKCDFLFFGSASSRRKLFNDNTFLELWCDPLIDYLGRKRCILVQTFDSDHKVKNAHTKRLFSSEIFKVRPMWLNAPYIFTAKQDNEVAVFVERINAQIEAEFDLSDFVSKDSIAKVLRRKKEDLVLIKKRLQHMKPKAVFLVNSCGKELYIEACKQLSIPTIELQHGNISPFVLAYQYSETATKKNFPDFFLSFGKYWESSIDFPISGDSIQTLGYPYLEDAMKMLPEKLKPKKLITFVSQTTNGKEMSEFACKLSKIVGEEWEVVYKLHPAEARWREIYKSLNHSNVRVIEDGESPSLYELFNQTAIVVGVYSTAIFEGLAFGCRTYILNLFGVEHMQPMIDEGICKLINEPEEISLEECSLVTSFNQNYIFEGNWRVNLDHALSKWL